MATLHNRVSRKELKEKAASETLLRNTLSFYCYFEIIDPVSLRNHWYSILDSLGVKGRIYIANEGINAPAVNSEESSTPAPEETTAPEPEVTVAPTEEPAPADVTPTPENA